MAPVRSVDPVADPARPAAPAVPRGSTPGIESGEDLVAEFVAALDAVPPA